MAKKNQREATFEAIMSVLANAGVVFATGSDVKSVLTSEHKKQVRLSLMNDFKSGLIDHTDVFAKTKMSSDLELSKYCSGLISNWIKKDPRLNGNTKYQAVNKGSREAINDTQVKELRKLLKATVGTDAEKEVSDALNSRLAEVRASKVKKPSIDVDVIPEGLRHLVK